LNVWRIRRRTRNVDGRIVTGCGCTRHIHVRTRCAASLAAVEIESKHTQFHSPSLLTAGPRFVVSVWIVLTQPENVNFSQWNIVLRRQVPHHSIRPLPAEFEIHSRWSGRIGEPLNFENVIFTVLDLGHGLIQNLLRVVRKNMFTGGEQYILSCDQFVVVEIFG